MSLVDVLMGGLVFSLASASSLQIYGSSLRWADGQEQREATAIAMELALAQGESMLRQQRDAAAVGANPIDCSTAAELLASSLRALPLPQGLTGEVSREGELVSLTVRADRMPERRRWLSPAAFGLCGAPSP